MRIKENDITAYFEAALHYWWLILAAIVFGSLLGLGLATFRKPLYEASATIQISIDRNRASIRDDITIYQADDRVRALILSDATLLNAIERLSTSIGETAYKTPASFRSAAKLSQGPASIHLIFYADDPDIAAAAVNAWAHASLDELQRAFVNAVRTSELQEALYEAHCSLEMVGESSEAQALWVCTSGESNVDPEELPEAILERVQASQGILPFFSFSLSQTAESPDSPVLWNRSSFLLSGITLGALAGFIIANLFYQRQGSNLAKENE